MTKTKQVLLLRPSEKATDTRLAFEKHSIDYQHLPMLTLKVCTPHISQSHIVHYQHCVFISTTAVDAFRHHYRFPTDAYYWAVGTKTAAHLSHQHVTVHATAPSIEQLSDALLSQLQSQQSVLLIAGQGGRRHLARRLAQAGHTRYNKLSLYRRIEQQYPPDTITRALAFCTIIILHSISLLRSLMTNSSTQPITTMTDLFHTVYVIAVSTRVAQAARHAGFRHVVVSQSARDKDILTCIDSLSVSPSCP